MLINNTINLIEEIVLLSCSVLMIIMICKESRDLYIECGKIFISPLNTLHVLLHRHKVAQHCYSSAQELSHITEIASNNKNE